jgi:flotillin
MNATTLLSQSAAGGGESFLIILIISALVVGIGMLVFFFSRYQKCPSDRILVVYGKTAGGVSSKCLHGGALFIWPVIQAFEYLDLTPIPIDIPLEGALTKQNIRVNIPSTFTVGISTDPPVMRNAADRLLGLQLTQVRDLARDIIFGQMRFVISTMDIEAINGDRDQLIERISDGVEAEFRKVGLRLINMNIQDITDGSGYLDALAKEALLNVNNRINMDVTQEIAALKEELKELKLAIQEIRTNSQGV